MHLIRRKYKQNAREISAKVISGRDSKAEKMITI